MLKFTIAIPTFNRPRELKECIDSVLQQTYLPSEVIVVDDGSLEKSLIEEIEKKVTQKGIKFVYYKKNHKIERRGLSESKNLILKIAQEEIVCIVDDDVILFPSTCEFIMRLWEENLQNEQLIGVGGIGWKYRKKRLIERIYNFLFGLTGKYCWDVNEVGFQVWDDGIKQVEKGYYMHGFISSFRKSLALKLGGFDVFLGGRTALEDVAFCLKAKNHGYFCLIDPRAQAIHKKSKMSREKEYLIGFKESQNRKVIFKRYCKQDFFHKVWFFWANIGWILRQFLVGNFEKGWGMLVGFVKKSEEA